MYISLTGLQYAGNEMRDLMRYKLGFYYYFLQMRGITDQDIMLPPPGGYVFWYVCLFVFAKTVKVMYRGRILQRYLDYPLLGF